MMLFPAVLMNFPNSKVCLIGEWSIITPINHSHPHLIFLYSLSVGVSRSKDVPAFGPPIPAGGVFTNTEGFKTFLITKRT